MTSFVEPVIIVFKNTFSFGLQVYNINMYGSPYQGKFHWRNNVNV
jgi:hypothetical protein